MTAGCSQKRHGGYIRKAVAFEDCKYQAGYLLPLDDLVADLATIFSRIRADLPERPRM